MLSIFADTHTHTIASGHAFSTVTENAREARERGMRFLCVTDHAPALSGAPAPVYFQAMISILPPEIEGVHILRGVEANVIDWNGSLDMPSERLRALEWVIASMHRIVIEPADAASHTRAWLAVAQNPDVDVMGHLGDPHYPFDHEAVVRACAEHGKIIEINNHSFTGRRGSEENCRDVARLCMRYRVPVVVSTDAHFWGVVGRFERSLGMLEEIGFPEELILNADFERFAEVARKKSGRVFTA